MTLNLRHIIAFVMRPFYKGRVKYIYLFFVLDICIIKV